MSSKPEASASDAQEKGPAPGAAPPPPAGAVHPGGVPPYPGAVAAAAPCNGDPYAGMYPALGAPPPGALPPNVGHQPPVGYGSPYGAPPPGYPPPHYGAEHPPMAHYGAPPPVYVGYPPAPVYPGYPPPHPGYAYPPPASPYGPPPPHGYSPYGAPPPPHYPGFAYPPPVAYGHYPPPHPGYAYPPPHGYPPPGPYGRERSRSPTREAVKHTCRFFIGIEQDEDFRVVRRIIGHGGAKMKDIVARTNGDAKLRLRGKGSGFMERDTKSESAEPLQLCISCPNGQSYHLAVQLTRELLASIYGEYNQWCQQNGKSERAPEIRMVEHHHTEGRADGGGYNSGGQTRKGRRGGRNRKGNLPITQGQTLAQDEDSDSSEESGPADAVDRGTRPDGAPGAEEIERWVEARNQARKISDFREADRIRDHLKSRGVVLSDEKGGHGSATRVTSWRYWKE